MIRARHSLLLFAVLCLATSLGCLEMDREGYRDTAAQEVCDEADACNNLHNLFGDGYDSHADCIVGERARFNDMWPESECGDGAIDPDQFDRCMDRARLAACDGSFLDQLSALGECRASEVCIN